jgi:hypothetical protein
MRAITSPERDSAAAGHWTFAYLEVTNYDGTWVNLGAVAVGAETADFLNTASITDDIDRNTLTMTATMRREVGAYSLVPFRTDSPLNVDDLGAYQPLLDLHREWKLWVCITARGDIPSGAGDFREFARGIVDRIDIAGEPATITIQGRGPEADLIDSLIYDTPITYGSGTLADVLQDMLDDQFGPAVYTLVVDASAPSFFVNEWEQTEEVGFWDLFSRTAALAGANVRFLYDASDNLELTLFTPNREALPGDEEWTSSSSEYEKLDLGIDLSGIRNFAVVKYQDGAGTVQTVTSPSSGLSASISRYGTRPILINLAASTQVNLEADAQALADAVVADLELPVMEQTIQMAGAWFGELWDYVALDANNVHYDEDQYGGVTAVSHAFENGMLTSTFALRGKPAGRYATWLQITGTGTVTEPEAPAVTSGDATFIEWRVPAPANTFDVGYVFTVNEATNSLRIDLATSDDFAVVLGTLDVTVAPSTSFSSSFTQLDADRQLTYYVRATPYSGPVAAGDPTGTPGVPWVATTDANPRPVDTATITVDRSTPGELRFNVVGGAGVEVGELVGSLAIPIEFVNVTEDDQWLALSTIPTAETEVGAEYRQQSYALGVGSIRVGANIKTLTGTPTIGANYTLDGFASIPSLVSFTPAGTGVRYSVWTAMPTPAKADIGVTWTVGAGADTAALDLYRVWIEYQPTTVAGVREHSDEHAPEFS